MYHVFFFNLGVPVPVTLKLDFSKRVQFTNFFRGSNVIYILWEPVILLLSVVLLKNNF